jgi:hypothetical protein
MRSSGMIGISGCYSGKSLYARIRGSFRRNVSYVPNLPREHVTGRDRNSPFRANHSEFGASDRVTWGDPSAGIPATEMGTFAYLRGDFSRCKAAR